MPSRILVAPKRDAMLALVTDAWLTITEVRKATGFDVQYVKIMLMRLLVQGVVFRRKRKRVGTYEYSLVRK